MKVKINIKPTFSVKWPMLKVVINNRVVFAGECHPNAGDKFIIEENIHPLDRNLLSIEHFDKKGKETILDKHGEVVSDRALILKSIMLDDFTVPELILHDKPFTVNWTKEQLREDTNRPKTIKNNLYFGYNGVYDFVFGRDSAKEYYVNLIEKERIANIHNKKEIVGPDGKKIEVFEFTGKLVDSNKKQTMTIEQLYERIQDED